MPCRPASCTRLAANVSRRPSTTGSDHIWISDSILSEAFARFLRVSHTHRRFGSNVPGPLEARRRNARRRMGCAVACGGGGAMPPDVGQLFGSTSAGRSRGDFKWEAPTPTTMREREKGKEGGWSWSLFGTKEKEVRGEGGGGEADMWGWGGRPPEQAEEERETGEFGTEAKELDWEAGQDYIKAVKEEGIEVVEKGFGVREEPVDVAEKAVTAEEDAMTLLEIEALRVVKREIRPRDDAIILRDDPSEVKEDAVQIADLAAEVENKNLAVTEEARESTGTEEVAINVDEREQADVALQQSRAALDRLLEFYGGKDVLDAEDLEPFLKFLSRSTADPDSDNIIRLLGWVAERSTTAGALSPVLALLVNHCKLEAMSTNAAMTILQALPKNVDWDHDTVLGQQLWDTRLAIWRALSSRPITHDTYETFMKEAEQNAREPEHFELMSDLLGTYTASETNLLTPATVSNDLAAILRVMFLKKRDRDVYSSFVDKIVDLLCQLTWPQKLDFLSWTHNTTELLCDMIPAESRQTVILFWLRCLRTALPVRRYGEAWEAIHSSLAARFRPSDLADHFKEMSPVEFVRALLNDWLPNADLTAFATAGGTTLGDAVNYKRFRFEQTRLTAEALPLIRAEFENLYANRDGSVVDGYTLTRLLIAFTRHRIAYHGIALEILRAYYTKYSAARLHNTFSSIIYNPDLDVSKDMSIALINHFLSIDQPTRALEVFRIVPSVSMTDCPGLAFALFKQGITDPDVVFELITRQPETVSMDERTVHKLNSTPEHINIVHLFAHELARSTKMTPRTSYRRVWTCYRYLQDRGAPITPLLSRSLVHAGIIRPAQLELPIPLRRIEYICSLVERLEGEQVAEDVRKLVHYIRRRTATRDAQIRVNRARMQFSEATDGLAKKARWRLKTWTKQAVLSGNDWGGPVDVFGRPETAEDLLPSSGEAAGINHLAVAEAAREMNDAVAPALPPAPPSQVYSYTPKRKRGRTAESVAVTPSPSQVHSPWPQVYSYNPMAPGTLQRRSFHSNHLTTIQQNSRKSQVTEDDGPDIESYDSFQKLSSEASDAHSVDQKQDYGYDEWLDEECESQSKSGYPPGLSTEESTLWQHDRKAAETDTKHSSQFEYLHSPTSGPDPPTPGTDFGYDDWLDEANEAGTERAVPISPSASYEPMSAISFPKPAPPPGTNQHIPVSSPFRGARRGAPQVSYNTAQMATEWRDKSQEPVPWVRRWNVPMQPLPPSLPKSWTLPATEEQEEEERSWQMTVRAIEEEVSPPLPQWQMPFPSQPTIRTFVSNGKEDTRLRSPAARKGIMRRKYWERINSAASESTGEAEAAAMPERNLDFGRWADLRDHTVYTKRLTLPHFREHEAAQGIVRKHVSEMGRRPGSKWHGRG